MSICLFSHTQRYTYHDIIAFNQKLSVKWPRNFKCVRDFSGGNFNLKEEGGEDEGKKKKNTHTLKNQIRLFQFEHKWRTLKA